MADDISDKLKSILNNPEMMNMLSGFMNSSRTAETNNESDDESIANIQNMVSRLNSGDDKRINLLNALRPYMRDSRANDIDRAVKMLKLTKIGSILKDL